MTPDPASGVYGNVHAARSLLGAHATMRSSFVSLAVSAAVALSAMGCRGLQAPPDARSFARKNVEWKSFTVYPVVTDGRFVATRADDIESDVSFSGFTGINYRVGWTFTVAGQPPLVTKSVCDAKPTGDVAIHGVKVDKPSFTCAPVASGAQVAAGVPAISSDAIDARQRGLWLVLGDGCRSGRAGFGSSELVLEATNAGHDSWRGHVLFKRGSEVVAAIELFLHAGRQGVWEKDGLSEEEQAIVAFTANALEWASEGHYKVRICGM